MHLQGCKSNGGGQVGRESGLKSRFRSEEGKRCEIAPPRGPITGAGKGYARPVGHNFAERLMVGGGLGGTSN